MRILWGVGVAFWLVTGAFAQQRTFGGSGFGNVVFPGRGQAPFRGNGFGNVVFPGLGHAPRVNPFSITDPSFAFRLGNTVSGVQPFDPTLGNGHGAVVVPFAYPVYVGGYAGQAYPQQQQPNVIVIYPPQPAPVIINQMPSDTVREVTTENPPEATPPEQGVNVYQSPTRTAAESTPSTESPYYLIAFKDHSIYSAVAYWVEGDTLHYFTSGNTHNQASLSLVDRKLTEELNRPRSVAVRLP